MVLNILTVHWSERSISLFAGNKQTITGDTLIRDSFERVTAKVSQFE